MNQIVSSLIRLIWVSVAILGLMACDGFNLPIYWLCSGTSQQLVLDQKGNVLESYVGSDPVMLEIWGSRVYQFLQGSFSGSYSICNPERGIGSTTTEMHLQLGSCHDESHFKRIGVFNLDSGELSIKEIRMQGDRVIRNEGWYQCRKKGHTFNFLELNHV